MYTITLPFKQVFQKLIQFLVCPPPSPPLLLGSLSLLPNFQKMEGGLTGSQSLEGSCWEIGVSFFIGGCSFYIKNKLKSEIFIDRKSL